MRSTLAVIVLLVGSAGLARAQDAPPSDDEMDAALEALDEELVEEAEGEADETPIEEAPVGLEEVEDEDDLFTTPELTVAYTPEDVFRIGGSVTLLGEEQLEAFEYDDPNAVMMQVPGVYVREEDGFGLRPNIGLRGASSDRSKKVTLMEDGVLFGPAPYAAPAAYYFPIISRMVGVEVFKGPAAILYGPNTIGGAVNFVSRAVPTEPDGGVDLAFGLFDYHKLDFHYGAGAPWGGFLLEAVDIGTTGFKELDADPEADTGFRRSEFVLTGMVQTDASQDVYNRFELRFGYSRERSNETYLGLSDADFRADPDRRYSATQLDRMTWWRTELRLTHHVTIGEHVEVRTDLYRHDFDRTWRRLNRFRDGPTLLDTLSDPTGRREVYYRVLTGEADSASVNDPFQGQEDLLVVSNARRFVAEGVQTRVRADFETGDFAHDLEVGARLHYDEIDRDHVERAYRMQNGALVRTADDPLPETDNFGQARALALYLVYGLRFAGLTVTPGVRTEIIHTELEDDLASTRSENDQSVLLPGVGAQYAITDTFGVLAGVHRGFSPVAPGQPDEVEPELSTNYELGVRYSDTEENRLGEVVGFVNDYTNLTGQCAGSAGCSPDLLDRQFNGGDVLVLGVEVAGQWSFELARELELPVRLSYTFTRGTFQTAFESDNPVFGIVEEGDEIPYVPSHQARVQAGLLGDRWAVHAGATYVGEMRETAGQGEPEDGELPLTDDYVLVDAVGAYTVFEGVELYLRVENLFDARPIVARRPFGARSTSPLTAQIGLRADL